MKRLVLFGAVACVLGLGASVGFAASNNEQNSKGKTMNYKIELKDVAAQPALVVKGKAKIEEVGPVIGEYLGKVEAYLASKKISPAGAPFTRTFNFANGVLEFEAGFPVSSKVETKGDIIATELPKGKVATTVHIGSQEKSQDAYEAIQAWMKKNEKGEAGAPWEVYLSDPASTPEDQSKMQVFFPVKS